MPKKKEAGLKSALDLAMERLEEQGVKTPKLSTAQKKKIQDIGKRHEAKIAETKIKLEGEIRAAALAGDAEKMEELQQHLIQETAKLREKMEAEKEAVWKSR